MLALWTSFLLILSVSAYESHYDFEYTPKSLNEYHDHLTLEKRIFELEKKYLNSVFTNKSQYTERILNIIKNLS